MKSEFISYIFVDWKYVLNTKFNNTQSNLLYIDKEYIRTLPVLKHNGKWNLKKNQLWYQILNNRMLYSHYTTSYFIFYVVLCNNNPITI